MFSKKLNRKLVLLISLLFVHTLGDFIAYAGPEEDIPERNRSLSLNVSTEDQDKINLIKENRKLRFQNKNLMEERDFYKNLIKKLTKAKSEIPSKKSSITESGNTPLMTGNDSPSNSYTKYDSASSRQESKNTQGKSVKETSKDIHITFLEDKLAQSRNEIQSLRRKISSSSNLFKPGEELRETPRESISPQRKQSEKSGLMVDAIINTKKEVYTHNEKTEINKKKKEYINDDVDNQKIIENQKLRIEFLEQEILAFSKYDKGKEKVPDASDHSEKDQEIENQKRHFAPQKELEELHAGGEIEKYIEKIKALEEENKSLKAQNAKLLQIDMAEATLGQTPVWIPFDADTFYHNKNLKILHKTSDQSFQEKMQQLKEEYNKIKQDLKPLQRVQLSCLEEDLEVEEFRNKKSSLRGAIKKLNDSQFEDFKNLFEQTYQTYEEFSELQKRNEIPGLEEYLKVQSVYETISSEISFEDFVKVTKEFELRKQKLAEIIKQKLDVSVDIKDETLESSCKKALDILVFEDRWLPIENFVLKYTQPPNFNDKNYCNSQFVLINRCLFLSKEFDSLEIYTRTVFREVKEGLEEQCPFKLFKKTLKNHSSEIMNINFLDVVRDMYRLRYLNQHWQQLQDRFSDLEEKIMDCHLAETVKDTLHIIMKKNAFQEYDPMILTGYARDLENNLEGSLSYRNIERWQKDDELDLREDIIDIYTTYRGIVSLGISLNNKNPKYKEFHEERI